MNNLIQQHDVTLFICGAGNINMVKLSETELHTHL